MRALCVVVGLLGIVFEDDAARVRCRLHYSCIVSMDRSPLRAGKAASRCIHMCTMLIFFAGDWYRTDCNRCPRDYRAQTLVAKQVLRGLARPLYLHLHSLLGRLAQPSH